MFTRFIREGICWSVLEWATSLTLASPIGCPPLKSFFLSGFGLARVRFAQQPGIGVSQFSVVVFGIQQVKNIILFWSFHRFLPLYGIATAKMAAGHDRD